MTRDRDRPVDLDNMTREELKDYVRDIESQFDDLLDQHEELRDEVDDMQKTLRDAFGMAHQADAKADEMADDLQEVKSFYDSYGLDDARDQREAWVIVLRTARVLKNDRRHKLPGNRVALYVDTIEDNTGYSDRHASNLIEEFGDEKDGATWKPYQRPSPATNNERKRKRLIIDLEVWGET